MIDRIESVQVKFEKRDAWVGLFWDRGSSYEFSRTPDPQTGDIRVIGNYVRLYLCVIPFLPIIVTVRSGDQR